MTTTSTIDLQIEQLTAQKAEIEAQQAAAIKALEEEKLEQVRIARRKADQDQRNVLTQELLNADSNNIISAEWKHDEDTNQQVVSGISFVIGTQKHDVRLSDWGNKGYKFELCGSYNNYATRKYTRVNTLLARIAEFKEIGERKIAATATKNDDLATVLKMVTETYPTAEVRIATRYNGRGRTFQETDYVLAKTDKGSISFSYTKNKHGEITTHVFAIEAKETDACQEIAKLILS